MNGKLVLFGLIFLIPMMLSSCWLPPPPVGFVVDDDPYGYHYQHRDYDHHHDYDRHHDDSNQRGWRGHRR